MANKTELTVAQLNEKRDTLAADIAERIAKFEQDTGVKALNVTATPRRAPNGQNQDEHAWDGQVRVRMEL